jgi:hypothetical protein
MSAFDNDTYQLIQANPALCRPGEELIDA